MRVIKPGWYYFAGLHRNGKRLLPIKEGVFIMNAYDYTK